MLVLVAALASGVSLRHQTLGFASTIHSTLFGHHFGDDFVTAALFGAPFGSFLGKNVARI